MASAEPHIGTLNEAHLHASLKTIYAEPGDRFEVPLEGYVVDILRGDLIVEIQTRSFGSMKRKLNALLDTHRIRLVHPIAFERWIVKLPKTKKDKETRRKSPKKQGLEALFAELVSVPYLIDHPNLEIELILVREDEVRRHDPKRAWRRKGWVVQERKLIEVIDRRVVRNSDDLISLIGGKLPEEFTTKDIAEQSGWQRRVAQQAAYCLRGCGRAEIVGKQGNALIYRLVAASPKARTRVRKKPVKSDAPIADKKTATSAKKRASKKKTGSKKTTKKRSSTAAAATSRKTKKAATGKGARKKKARTRSTP